jgi:outer membrane protein assembly factor BamB
MKKLLSIALVILLSLPMVTATYQPTEQNTLTQPAPLSDRYEGGYRFNHQGWIYVHVEGLPYERGFQHGYLLSSEIQDAITRWSHTIHNYPKLKLISPHLSKERYEQVAAIWWEFCKTSCQRLFWDKFPAEYQLEIRGIADGAASNGAQIFGEPISYLDILTINEMYELMSKLTRIPRAVHPLRTLLYRIEQIVPELQEYDMDFLIGSFLVQDPAHHCNGFIATGDATTDGQMIISHTTICGGTMWWWNYYISLRWNIVLDIQPQQGHRLTLTTSPGFIWSDEDYYQNDAGIVLIETTDPQGLYDNKGLPLSVRCRNALQYGSSIDDVLHSLRYRNDGSMNAVWLIGDAKTGEIARFELGYSQSAVYRTFNGFYWSANNPYDLGVRLEKMNWKLYLKRFISQFIGIPGFGYHSIFYRPEARDLKYEELGNEYYGRIDADIVKQISSTSPIGDWTTDCKVSDSYLLAHNGLWVFFGNLENKTLVMPNFNNPGVTYEDVYPTGWTRIFGLPATEDHTVPTVSDEYGGSFTSAWEFDTHTDVNYASTATVVADDVAYVATSPGELYALTTDSGTLVWNCSIGTAPTTPVVYNDKLFIGSRRGLSVFNLEGELQWMFPCSLLVAPPLIVGNKVYIGDKTGMLYALSIADGSCLWEKQLDAPVYLTSSSTSRIIAAAGNTCMALEGDDGTCVWTFIAQGPITSQPVVYNGLVYVASWDTNIYALFEGSGTVKWTFPCGWGCDVALLVHQNMLYCGSEDTNMYALDAVSGDLQWVFSCKSGIHSNPAVYADMVVFGSDDGRLYLLNCTTGKNIKYFAPGFTTDDDTNNFITTPILSSPAVTEDGRIIVGVQGIIYALNIS